MRDLREFVGGVNDVRVGLGFFGVEFEARIRV